MTVSYQRGLLERYHTPGLSTGSLTSFVSLVLAVVVTLLFCWNTNNFWVWRQTYYEQPKVGFSKGVVVEVGLSSGAVARYSTLADYASVLEASSGAGGVSLVPSIESSETDTNGDGFPDVIDVRVVGRVPPAAGPVSHASTALLFSVYLDQRVRMSVQGLAVVSFPVGSMGAAKVSVTGDLVLDPPRELPMDGSTLVEFASPVLGSDALRGPEDLAFSSFVPRYYERNITTSLDLRGPPLYEVPSGPGFELSARIHVPVLALDYKPGVWESLKFALIQLISIGFVVFIIRSYILDYLFTQHIIAARVVRETDPPHAHSF